MHDRMMVQRGAVPPRLRAPRAGSRGVIGRRAGKPCFAGCRTMRRLTRRAPPRLDDPAARSEGSPGNVMMIHTASGFWSLAAPDF